MKLHVVVYLDKRLLKKLFFRRILRCVQLTMFFFIYFLVSVEILIAILPSFRYSHKNELKRKHCGDDSSYMEVGQTRNGILIIFQNKADPQCPRTLKHGKLFFGWHVTQFPFP